MTNIRIIDISLDGDDKNVIKQEISKIIEGLSSLKTVPCEDLSIVRRFESSSPQITLITGDMDMILQMGTEQGELLQDVIEEMVLYMAHPCEEQQDFLIEKLRLLEAQPT